MDRLTRATALLSECIDKLNELMRELSSYDSLTVSEALRELELLRIELEDRITQEEEETAR